MKISPKAGAAIKFGSDNKFRRWDYSIF